MANFRRPVTKVRIDYNIPQPHSLPREGFKFPPATPKPVRTIELKLGSGFEGIILKSAKELKVSRAN